MKFLSKWLPLVSMILVGAFFLWIILAFAFGSNVQHYGSIKDKIYVAEDSYVTPVYYNGEFQGMETHYTPAEYIFAIREDLDGGTRLTKRHVPRSDFRTCQIGADYQWQTRNPNWIFWK